MGKTYKHRELRKALRKYDKRFRFLYGRGKGSHCIIEHPDVNGCRRVYPLPYHGDNCDIKAGYIKDIKRIFNLPNRVLP